MAIIEIAKIQVRRGEENVDGIPALEGGEFAWTVDTQKLFIGNGTLAEGAPETGVTQIYPSGGGGGAGSALLENNVPVVGTSVGAIDAGYTFLEGTSFTNFVELISTRLSSPSLSLTPAYSNLEIGTVIANLTLDITFSQQNAGPELAYRLYKDASEISNAHPYTDTSVEMTEVAIVYQAELDYDDGAPINGIPGIGAGTITSNSLSYIGLRKAFYDVSAPVATSANIRALSNYSWNTGNNSDVNSGGLPLVPAPTPSFTITIPIGATSVSFAYPATSRSVASVLYQELSNSEVKANFVETSVSVEGANAYTPISYRVFTYTPVEPFSIENHYKVFI